MRAITAGEVEPLKLEYVECNGIERFARDKVSAYMGGLVKMDGTTALKNEYCNFVLWNSWRKEKVKYRSILLRCSIGEGKTIRVEIKAITGHVIIVDESTNVADRDIDDTRVLRNDGRHRDHRRCNVVRMHLAASDNALTPTDRNISIAYAHRI